MNKEVIIIGGGIIGLCSAYYLQKEGHSVTIVDQSNMDTGASYVNAGYLSPSHIIPLASPGMMKKGLKWMFNSSSPLYIKPRLDLDFLKWTWAFNKSCNPKHVKKAIPVIKDISVLSQELYDELKASPDFRFHYDKKGLFMLCQSEKVLDKEINVAKLALEQGLEVNILSKTEVQKLEPNIKVDCIGAVHYLCDYHTTPHEFMEDMKIYLKAHNVTFLTNEKVLDFTMKGEKIMEIQTNKQTLTADEFVAASGAWTAQLSKKMGISMLMEAGKGYSINKKEKTGITIPTILTERKIAVTPMNGFTRFAGTMEIAGINKIINKKRVEAIVNGVRQYYPEITISDEDKEHVAYGNRPVTPDGLAYIGKSKKCKNLTFAAGHAMMGWSMGTATGKLVSELISNQKLSMNLSVFNPDRKF
jgi:D-amino-acid dehydrogenase